MTGKLVGDVGLAPRKKTKGHGASTSKFFFFLQSCDKVRSSSWRGRETRAPPLLSKSRGHNEQLPENYPTCCAISLSQVVPCCCRPYHAVRSPLHFYYRRHRAAVHTRGGRGSRMLLARNGLGGRGRDVARLGVDPREGRGSGRHCSFRPLGDEGDG